MKSQAVPTTPESLAGSASDEKFAMIVKSIRWAFNATRNPRLACLDVTAGPAGVVVSGEGGPVDAWSAKLLAEQYSRGLLVTCNLTHKESGNDDPHAA